jgi:hypothetical protein
MKVFVFYHVLSLCLSCNKGSLYRIPVSKSNERERTVTGTKYVIKKLVFNINIFCTFCWDAEVQKISYRE